MGEPKLGRGLGQGQGRVNEKARAERSLKTSSTDFFI